LEEFDISYCKEPSLTPIERNTCYAELAFYKKDSTACDKIPIEKSPSYACSYTTILRSCYYHTAPSISVCDNITEQERKDYCYSGIADAYNNILACDKIKDKEKKNDCYFFLAYHGDDASVCDNIQDQFTKEYCIEVYNWAREIDT